VLTRRHEAYHEIGAHRPADPASDGQGAPIIHHAEHALHFDGRPPMDREDRALFVDRIIPADLAFEKYVSGDYAPVGSWARVRMRWSASREADTVVVRLEGESGAGSLIKEIRIRRDGGLTVRYHLTAIGPAAVGHFAPEISLAAPLDVLVTPTPALPLWRFPIETVAKSERGLDRTLQGMSVTALWPATIGEFAIELGPPGTPR
jgi:hypothetical protein